MKVIGKLSSYGSRLRPKFWKITFGLLCGLWVPLPFLNFDSHHDGLILSTIRLTQASISSGGDYPFNQYGPFWSTPFVLLSEVVPSDNLFLSVRVLTVLFYFLSAYILFRIAQIFLVGSPARAVVLLFLGSQPFVSSLGSDLVPWPSAVVMPLVLMMAYLLLSSVSPNNVTRISQLKVYSAGLLLPLIILTRLQVGFILLAVTFFFFFLYRLSRHTLIFSIGIFTSTTLVLGILQQLGWLKQALYDQLIFGATYLSADKSTFPKPLITFFLASIFLLFLIYLSRVLKFLSAITSIQLSVIAVLVLSLVVFSLEFIHRYRGVPYIRTLDVLTRRFWVSVLLGTLILATFILGQFLLQVLRNSRSSLHGTNKYILLLGFAIAFQIQMYPLFDQMHSWWGSPLTFLVLSIEIQKRFDFSSISRSIVVTLRIIAPLLLALALLVPWSQQVLAEKKGLPTEVGNYLFTDSISANSERLLQEFFMKNIPSGSTVLNLCDNTNIFFAKDRYLPSSRFFVYWAEQMSHAPRIRSSMENSNPDFIVSCGLTHALDLRARQESMQLELINSITGFQSPIAAYTEREDKTWRVYRNSK